MSEEALINQLAKELARSMRPNPTIYWADLLLSAGLGWSLFFASHRASSTLPFFALSFAAALFLLRATYFIHELAHIQRKDLPGFQLAWHAVIGVWMLIPSLMIGAHADHHRRSTYGTPRDPEYAPIARWRPWRFALDLGTLPLVPPLLALRWGLLTPLSIFSARLRRLLIERASTLVINPSYVRAVPEDLRRWRAQEAFMAAFVLTISGLCYAGVIAPALLAHWWRIATIALIANQLRTYLAHAYEGDGHPMTKLEQMQDTITLAGWPVLTDALAPVGDRFHAIHHLFPFLPYHAFPRAHRRLLQILPPDSSYRSTIRSGLVGAARNKLSRARRGSAGLVPHCENKAPQLIGERRVGGQ